MAKVSSAREDMLAAAVELFRARGYDGCEMHQVAYENPLRFFAQSNRFNFTPPLPVARD